MNKVIVTNGESILRGADGRVQGRKLAAWICFEYSEPNLPPIPTESCHPFRA